MLRIGRRVPRFGGLTPPTHTQDMRHGAEEACWAHNPEVGGSKPPVATHTPHVCSTRLRVRVPPRIGACTDHSWLGARAEIWRNNQRFFRLRGPMDKACAYGLANTTYSVVATIDPARVAQSAERKTLNLVVEGSSPSSGATPTRPRSASTQKLQNVQGSNPCVSKKATGRSSAPVQARRRRGCSSGAECLLRIGCRQRDARDAPGLGFKSQLVQCPSRARACSSGAEWALSNEIRGRNGAGCRHSSVGRASD